MADGTPAPAPVCWECRCAPPGRVQGGSCPTHANDVGRCRRCRRAANARRCRGQPDYEPPPGTPVAVLCSRCEHACAPPGDTLCVRCRLRVDCQTADKERRDREVHAQRLYMAARRMPRRQAVLIIRRLGGPEVAAAIADEVVRRGPDAVLAALRAMK